MILEGAALLIIAKSDPVKYLPQKTMYPSGVKEIDKYNPYAKPASKMPLFALERTLVDKDNHSVLPGQYLAAISKDKKYIMLFANDQVEGVFLIDNFNVLEKQLKVNSAVLTLKANGTVAEIRVCQDMFIATAQIKLNP
ncbi:MAG: hypothetical protein PHX18_04880 [Candidatus Gastranaerophilales bacterium]|nr:hypothetical protein [Candidatus Gastranaerophilales bacterium]